jgi:soluble lytic murein transglycosylase-like protein
MKKIIKILFSFLLFSFMIGSVSYSVKDTHTMRTSSGVFHKHEKVKEEKKEKEQKKIGRIEIDQIIKRKSREHGVDPKLIRAMVKVESNFKADAVSPKGAAGLMQLMPNTAAGLGVKNSFCPEQNIEGGIKHLKWLLGRYDNDKKLALAAYNMGHKRVKDSIPDVPETINYVAKVMAIYRGDNE